MKNSRRFFAFSDLVIFHLVSTSLSHRVIPSPHTHTQGALLLRTHGKRLDCNIRSRETQNLDSHLLYAELFFNRQSTAFTFILQQKIINYNISLSNSNLNFNLNKQINVKPAVCYHHINLLNLVISIFTPRHAEYIHPLRSVKLRDVDCSQ